MTIQQKAIEFLRLSSSGEVAEAYQRHVAPGFVHHNPHFEGTREALAVAMQENAQLNPDKTLEVRTAIQGKDLVCVHSKVHFPAKSLTISVVHIFRFHRGKIVELWDVGQQVPESMPNVHGMF